MTEPFQFRLTASMPRRIFAAAMFVLLAFVLYEQSLGNGPLWVKLVLTAAGTGTVVMGIWLWITTEKELVIEDGALREVGGRELARLDNIAQVEKGALAMKPAGGFTLKLKQKTRRGWAPGLWWAWGRTVAVGGVTHPSMGKAMAEMIEAKILEAENGGANSAD